MSFFSADYFKYLSRSFSLPNLTFTPLESLLPTEDEMLEAALDYTDDTNFEPISPVKNLDENTMWHIGKKALFRNKRFALNKMFQRNASKFAIFYV